MSITSLIFAAFSLMAILVFWVLPKRLRPVWLMVVSLAFIITWSWELAAFLLVIGLLNYLTARQLAGAKHKKLLLWSGISFNIATLGMLKYWDFFLPRLVRLLGWLGIKAITGGLELVVSVGLSFVALQMISYLVDVSHKLHPPEKNPFKFGVYLFYFPKFLAGPIERAKVFLPRLEAADPPGVDGVMQAFALILVGLLRKRLIADSLSALIPAGAFTDPLHYSTFMLVVWLLAYAFSLYNDFAGYSSIARGVSRLFGIELTNNFSVPYASRTFAEFWNRWHISLSNWLRDYIFFPVSRFLQKRITNPDNLLNVVLPPLVTMLASGLWHGASWTLLIWGGLHGAYLALERLVTLKKPRVTPDQMPKFRQVLGNIVVFIGVLFVWVPFRLDLVTTKRFLASFVLPSHWLLPDRLWFYNAIHTWKFPLTDLVNLNIPDPRILLLLVVAVLLDWAQNRRRDEFFLLRFPRWARVALTVLMFFVLIFLSFSTTRPPFVYQGF